MDGAAAAPALTQDAVISGFYDAGTNQTTVNATAQIPEGYSHPLIMDSNGDFYTYGLELHYDENWVPTTATTVHISVPSGWIVEGWTLEKDGRYRATIPADTITTAQAFRASTLICFYFYHPEKQIRHDPGMRVTPT